MTSRIVTLIILLTPAAAFQSLLPQISLPFAQPKQSNEARALENQLLSLVENSDRRLDNSAEITSLVARLESMPSIPRPAVAPEIYGRWRLLQTSNADTASPIQRKVRKLDVAVIIIL